MIEIKKMGTNLRFNVRDSQNDDSMDEIEAIEGDR